MNIKPTDFSKTMNAILEQYGAGVIDVVTKAADDVSKDSRVDLRKNSTGEFENRSGDYRRGWRARLDKGRIKVEAHVYNKTNYRLTHLLEFGHAKQNGGRTRAFPHIEGVNREAQEEFEQRIREGVSKL